MKIHNLHQPLYMRYYASPSHPGQFGAIRPVMIYFQTDQHQTQDNNEALAAVSACASLILHNKSTKAETETKGFIPKHL